MYEIPSLETFLPPFHKTKMAWLMNSDLESEEDVNLTLKWMNWVKKKVKCETSLFQEIYGFVKLKKLSDINDGSSLTYVS